MAGEGAWTSDLSDRKTLMRLIRPTMRGFGAIYENEMAHNDVVLAISALLRSTSATLGQNALQMHRPHRTQARSTSNVPASQKKVLSYDTCLKSRSLAEAHKSIHTCYLQAGASLTHVDRSVFLVIIFAHTPSFNF